LGGYREVGRSSLLSRPTLEDNIDCGLSPEPAIRGAGRQHGSDVNKAFPYLDSANLSINELDAVVITHAHMDHTGLCHTCSSSDMRVRSTARRPTRDLAALAAQRLHKAQRKGPAERRSTTRRT
jgi:uncharacterized protein